MKIAFFKKVVTCCNMFKHGHSMAFGVFKLVIDIDR